MSLYAFASSRQIFTNKHNFIGKRNLLLEWQCRYKAYENTFVIYKFMAVHETIVETKWDPPPFPVAKVLSCNYAMPYDLLGPQIAGF